MSESRHSPGDERPRRRELPTADPEIPGLAGAMDPVLMAPRLLSVLRVPEADRPAFDLKVRTMHLKPGRHCLIHYSLSSEQSSAIAQAIGKVFAKGRRAARLWDVLQQVFHVAPVNSLVREPLAYLDDLDLVLMERLSGNDLLSLLAAGDASITRDATGLAAASLSAFHAVPVAEGKLGSLDEELASLRKHSTQYGESTPQVASAAHRLLDQIENLAAKLPAPAAPSLIHTGFRPDAIFIEGERAAFLDLDGWTVGDPALDLGGFCAEVWNESRKPERGHLLEYRELFLDEYLKHAAPRGLRQRTLVYEAFTLVRLTLRRMRRIQREDTRGSLALPAEQLLTRAEECLTEVSSQS